VGAQVGAVRVVNMDQAREIERGDLCGVFGVLLRSEIATVRHFEECDSKIRRTLEPHVRSQGGNIAENASMIVDGAGSVCVGH
jgi:hypothetical protein